MSKNTFLGCTDEAHPELFNLAAMPTQPKEKKPGQLSEDKIRQFFELVIIFKYLICNSCNDAVEFQRHSNFMLLFFLYINEWVEFAAYSYGSAEGTLNNVFSEIIKIIVDEQVQKMF